MMLRSEVLQLQCRKRARLPAASRVNGAWPPSQARAGATLRLQPMGGMHANAAEAQRGAAGAVLAGAPAQRAL
jgi:hypothetical protein